VRTVDGVACAPLDGTVCETTARTIRVSACDTLDPASATLDGDTRCLAFAVSR